MSSPLPNLAALLSQLVGDTPGCRDARTLAEAAAEAGTEDEMDAAIDDVITRWRRQ